MEFNQVNHATCHAMFKLVIVSNYRLQPDCWMNKYFFFSDSRYLYWKWWVPNQSARILSQCDLWTKINKSLWHSWPKFYNCHLNFASFYYIRYGVTVVNGTLGLSLDRDCDWNHAICNFWINTIIRIYISWILWNLPQWTPSQKFHQYRFEPCASVTSIFTFEKMIIEENDSNQAVFACFF